MIFRYINLGPLGEPKRKVKFLFGETVGDMLKREGIEITDKHRVLGTNGMPISLDMKDDEDPQIYWNLKNITITRPLRPKGFVPTFRRLGDK